MEHRRSLDLSSELSVRVATFSDADAIFRLVKELAVSYRTDPAAFAANFPRLLADTSADVLVASSGGNVVGYVVAFRLLTLYANGPVTQIQELVVDPSCRGQGVGTRLVEAIFKRAWTAGCAEVTVATRRAGGFYQRLGFVETAGYFKSRRQG